MEKGGEKRKKEERERERWGEEREGVNYVRVRHAEVSRLGFSLFRF